MDQISQKSSLNKKIGVKLGNVIFPPLLDHLTEHHWVMWSLSYRADHDNHPGKFVDRIFSINEVSHSMDSWFLHKVLEKANKKTAKKDLQILRKVFQVHPLSSHMPSMDMENKNDRHRPGLWVEWVPEPLDPYYGNSLFCVNCIYYLLSGPMMGPFSRGSIITQAQKQSTVSCSVLVSLFLWVGCGSGSAWVLMIPASTCPSYANSCRFTQGEEISRGVS